MTKLSLIMFRKLKPKRLHCFQYFINFFATIILIEFQMFDSKRHLFIVSFFRHYYSHLYSRRIIRQLRHSSELTWIGQMKRNGIFATDLSETCLTLCLIVGQNNSSFFCGFSLNAKAIRNISPMNNLRYGSDADQRRHIYVPLML